MPLLLLASIFTNLFTWIFIAGDIYLWRQWYLYKDIIDGDHYSHDYAQRCLIGAIAMLVYMLLGKFILRLFLGKARPGDATPKPERYPEQEAIQRSDGSVIHIEHGGVKGKPAIIFIHGWNSNSMQWYYQKKYFEKDYHLILMDLPGLGLSTKPANKDFSLENMATDLKMVIGHTQPKDPVLWGHSMGGFTILTFCKLFKQELKSIKGIILEHTTYTNPTKTSILSSLLTAIQNPILKPICWIMITLSPIFWLSKWMSFFNGNSLLSTRFLTFAGTESYQQLNFSAYLSTLAPPSVTGRGVLAMFEYDASRTLGEIPVPVLVIGATSDRLTKYEASQHMSDVIPGGKLLTLNPAGHMGLMERHEEVNTTAGQFIAG